MNNRYMHWLWVLSVGLSPWGGLQAGPLSDAYSRALNNHPSIERGAFEVERQVARTEIASSVLKPQLEISMLENQIEQRASESITDFDGSTQRAVASQTLVDFESFARLRREQLLVDSTSFSLASVEQNLAFELTERYLNVVSSQSRLNAIEELVSGLEKRLVQAATMQQQGQLSRLDLIRVETRLSQRRAELASTRGEVEGAIAALMEVDPGFQIASVQSPDVTEVNWAPLAGRVELIDLMLDVNPAIQAIQAEVRAEYEGLEATGRRRLPKLTLNASYEDSNVGSNNRQITDTATTVIGVTLSMPLYRGGALSAERREQASVVSRLESDLEAQRRFLIRSLDEAIARFDSARVALPTENENVRGQADAVDVLEQALNRGAISQAELLDAFDNLANAKISRDQVAFNGLLGWLRVRVLTGQFSSADFERIESVVAQYQR